MTVQKLLLEELARADGQERMNILRRYFAASRYTRLLIQQALVRSARDRSFASKVRKMEQTHNKDFADTARMLRKSRYFNEFLAAVKEEDDALSKIVEAYDKRMNKS